jgi:hypothetical protein
MAKKFPDLTGDGKVTQKDILKGRGVKLKKGGQAKRKFYEGGGASKMSSVKLGTKLLDANERRKKQIKKEEKKKIDKAFLKYADRGTSGDKSLGDAIIKATNEADRKTKATERGTDQDFRLLATYGRDAPKDRGFNTRRYANGGAAIVKTNQKPHMS